MFKTFVANFMFIMCCFPAWLRFYIFLNQSSMIQMRVLRKIIKQNMTSDYCRKYKFSQIKDYKTWRNEVPIIEYEDIEPYIVDKCSFTNNKIKLYEPTSGSSGLKKIIPYTEELREEFQQGIKVWIFDLYIHNPVLFFYKSYWSISPKAKTDDLEVGFEKDEEYFSKFEQKFLKHIMVQPDLEGDFCKNTAEELIKERTNIGLISIWSPTFLDSILRDYVVNFKNLRILSCWADGSSEFYAKKLQEKYPNVKIQPKGLLSTEGITSFPLCKIGCVISYLSHFYEFLTSEGNIYLLSELKLNGIYTVILTTSGGLYRYNTHDVIKVIGFYKKLPIVKFLGRDNNVSDFFGEKISENFVKFVLKRLLGDDNGFCVLGFNQDRYTLYVEKNFSEKELEDLLEQNYHYKNCIELGQLKPCTVEIVDNLLEKYVQYYISKGIKQGDIKLKLLDNNICDILDL